MELTDSHLEKIREVARSVEYGSITINISADSKKLDLNVQSRLKFEDNGLAVCLPGENFVNYRKP